MKAAEYMDHSPVIVKYMQEKGFVIIYVTTTIAMEAVIEGLAGLDIMPAIERVGVVQLDMAADVSVE